MLLGISLLLSVQACTNPETPSGKNNSRLELVPEPDLDLRLEYERNQAFMEMSTDSLWEYLVFEKGGCLTGGQYARGGQGDDRICVMKAAKEWEIFFHRTQEELTTVLLSKLADTSTTSIHTCPYFMANEGEVAVYALQQLYDTNWFDFEIFQPHVDSIDRSENENHQSWLQGILQDQTQREQLLDYWQSLAEK